MTLNELIEELEATRNAEGGDKEVMIEARMEDRPYDYFGVTGVTISKPGAPVTTVIMIEVE